eukprot:scaffold42417_cov68-Phaeocystis_antarctica.AAC.1
MRSLIETWLKNEVPRSQSGSSSSGNVQSGSDMSGGSTSPPEMDRSIGHSISGKAMRSMLNRKVTRGSGRSSSVKSGSSGHVRCGKRSRSRARSLDRWIGGIFQPDQSHSGRSKLGSVGHVRLGSEMRRRLTRKARLGAAG